MTCARTDGLLLQDHPGQKTQRPKEIFGAAFFVFRLRVAKRGFSKMGLEKCVAGILNKKNTGCTFCQSQSIKATFVT